MDVFLRVDINIAAMILLGAAYFMAHRRLDGTDGLNRSFLNVSRIILLQLGFETLTCVINRQQGAFLAGLSEILHVALFAIAPLLTYYWYRLAVSLACPERSYGKYREILLMAPIAINAVLAALSPVFDIVFYIDADNVYHRGDFFIISSVVTYSYILYGFGTILAGRRRLIRQEFQPLVLFGILPLAGGIAQTLFYGPLLMWSSTAFSLVIVYAFLQQRMVQLDHLTGAWSRQSFEDYIAQRLAHRQDAGFGIIYADIDGLKAINDRHGHAEGDAAIRTAIGLLRGALRKSDIVARLGGDEFIAVVDCDRKEDLQKTIDRIEADFDAFNRGSALDYPVRCSFGADIIEAGDQGIDDLLRRVDRLMYAQKTIRKTEPAATGG